MQRFPPEGVARRRRAAIAAAATALALVAVGVAALWRPPPSGVAMAIAVAFIPYAVLVHDARALSGPRARWAALATVASTGLLLVAAPTVLSDDLFRYLWDARVLRHGIDPYRYAPDDPALAHLRDALHARVNHPTIPTIYPPLAQIVFAAADAVAHAPWTLKATALTAHLGTTVLVGRLAAERAPGAVWVYGLNPLALTESALGGHVDAVVALSVVGFVLALERGRGLAAAALAGVVSGVKLVGIALAPLGLRHGWRVGGLGLVLALLAVVPLVGAGWGSNVTSGFGHYARRWQGNTGAFIVVESASRAAIGGLGRLSGAPSGHVSLEPLRPVLESVRGTALDPRAGVLAEKKGRGDLADFEVDYVAGLLARGLVFLFVMGLAFHLARRRVDPVLAARWVLLSSLLLAPQVHPWYLLWLLPLEVACARVAGLVWSAAVLVAYAPLDGWLAMRQWHEPPLAAVLEYGLVFAVIAVEELPRPAGRAGPSPTDAA